MGEHQIQKRFESETDERDYIAYLNSIVSHPGFIQEALKAKGADNPCVRCGNKSFEILPHLTVTIIHDDQYFYFSGTSDILIAIFCDNCGYKYEYSARLLGLIPGIQKEQSNG